MLTPLCRLGTTASQVLCLLLTFIYRDAAPAQTDQKPTQSTNSSVTQREFSRLLEQAVGTKDHDAAMTATRFSITSAKLMEPLKEADELWLKGNAVKGIPKYLNLLGEVERAYGKDSAMAGLVLFRLGFLHSTHGDSEKALPYLERSLKLIGPLPDDRPNLVTKANLYWGLGMSYKALLKHEQAIQAFSQSLKLKEKLLGADDPSLVEILVEVADLHSLWDRPLASIPLLERALAISEKKFGAESAEVARVLASLGNTKSHAGHFEPALVCLKRSLQIRNKRIQPSNSEIGVALHNLGSLYAGQDDYQQAMPLLERGVELLKKNYVPNETQSAIQFAGALHNLGTAQIKNGDYDKGIAALQRSLAVTESAFGSASVNLVSALNSTAVAWKDRSDFDRARRFYERSLRILEGAPAYKNRERVDTLNNLAQLLLDIGDEDTAFKLFSQAQALGENQLGSTELPVAYSLNGLASINQRRGNMPKALILFESSLAILENKLGPSHRDVAAALNNIAVLLENTGATNRAWSTLQKALAIQEQVLPKGHRALATTLNNLGGMLAANGDLTNALAHFRKSLAITDALFGKDNPHSCALLETLAPFEVGAGEWENGLNHFTEAARRRRRFMASQMLLGQGPSVFGAYDARASSDGFHSLFRSAEGWWLSRPAAISGAEQLSLGKALLEEVESIAAFLAASGQPRTQELLAQSGKIKERLDAMVRPTEVTWLRERTNWKSSERDKLEQELGRIEAKLAERVGLVAQTVRERNLSLADIARSLPPQSALVDFVHYRRYDFTAKTNLWKEARYAAYVTFPPAAGTTNFAVERVDLGEAAPINAAVAELHQLFAERRIAPQRLEPVLQRLGALLYAPLARYLTNVSHLIVCPDGQLGRLPFELLPVDAKGRFLVEDKLVTYVSSGREVARLAQPRAAVATTAPLVMGNPDFDFILPGSSRREEAPIKPGTQNAELGTNSLSLLTSAATSRQRFLSRSFRDFKFTPLPDSEHEARKAAAMLGTNCVLRLGASAREADLKAVSSPRVLHLATHGFFLTDQEFKRTNGLGENFLLAGSFPSGGGFPSRQSFAPPGQDWENPLIRCGIALAGANRATGITNALAEDGILTGLEAALLNLQGTELVILSACDSGSGDVKIGEGVMSLRRAFTIAGAETVLASHWKVNDAATSALMTEFMRRWQAGTPRGQALREAQLSLLRSKDFSNPYFWAAFTLTGQWR